MNAAFRPEFRADPRGAFDLWRTATGRGTVPIELQGRRYLAYKNLNFSVYSGQRCNARCGFCVEELRPLSRGRELAAQRTVEVDDARYFERLEAALDAVAPLNPSVSITGGEPSLDPRLPRLLETLALRGSRKRTLTTNGSGLLRRLPDGGDLLDLIAMTGLDHLNLSRAHWDESRNQQVMGIRPALTNADVHTIVERARDANARPRLSCVLLRDHVNDLASACRYLDWAAMMGVDNVVFRQLMAYDPRTARRNSVTRYTDAQAAPLRPLVEAIRPSDLDAPGDPRFRFVRHVLGYYYAVEVYHYAGPFGGVDVCVEGADLAHIEADRATREAPVLHELVFHPDGALCSTWQPWDGRVL